MSHHPLQLRIVGSPPALGHKLLGDVQGVDAKRLWPSLPETLESTNPRSNEPTIKHCFPYS